MTLRLVPAPDVATAAGPQGIEAFAVELRNDGCSERTVSAYLSDLAIAGVGNPDTAYATHRAVAGELAADDGCSVRTRSRRLSALARYYDFTNPGSTASNPYRVVRRPKLGVTLPIVVPTPEQSRAAIEHLLNTHTAASLRTAAAIALMAGAGLRVGEATSLQSREVNVAGKRVSVFGKGRVLRTVDLSDAVCSVLRIYVECAGPARPDDLFLGVTPRTVQRAVKDVAVAVGLPPETSPHAFRHGFGTALVGAGSDIETVRDLMGHASVTTTQTYLHTSSDRRASAVEAAL